MQIDCFIVTDRSHRESEQNLYAILKKEGYAPRFLEKRIGTIKAMADARTTTDTYLLCQDTDTMDKCIILKK